MVRDNIIHPKSLSDQHLIAEYREYLMLFGSYKYKIPEGTTDNQFNYKRFYKDKLLYLCKRHKLLIDEMKERRFKPNINIKKDGYPDWMWQDWEPSDKHIFLAIERIIGKIYVRPDWYRYYGEYKDPEFFVELVEKYN